MSTESPRHVTVGAFHGVSITLFILVAALAVISCSGDSSKQAARSEPVHATAEPDSRPWKTEYRSDIAVTLTSQRVRQCAEFRYLEESTDPPTYLIECLETGVTFHVVPSLGEVTSTLKLDILRGGPSTPASRFTATQLCKAGIAVTMGRSASNMSASETGGIVDLSYVRDDGTEWTYRCKVEGTRIIWGAPGGRWRDTAADGILTYRETKDGSLRVTEKFQDGSTNSDTFSLEQLAK